MRSYSTLLIGCVLLGGAACSGTAPVPASSGTAPAPVASVAVSPGAVSQPAAVTSAPTVTTSQGKVEVCDLLTAKDLQAIQGETLKETKPSARSEGGFMIAQCFYSLPTFTKSISLLVAERGESAGARDPKDFWRETFQRAEEEAKERAEEKEKDKHEKNKDKEKPKTEGREEEEERAVPPQKIAGVGDDAYWTGNRVGGALYALKGNTYIRISVGGPGDQATMIRKTKALAQAILKRL
jgi:hypothetical protein